MPENTIVKDLWYFWWNQCSTASMLTLQIKAKSFIQPFYCSYLCAVTPRTRSVAALCLDALFYGCPSSWTCLGRRRMRLFIVGRWFWWSSPLSCHCQGMLVSCAASPLAPGGWVVLFFIFLQRWEGADQVWGAVQVVAAMTGEWAVKPPEP